MAVTKEFALALEAQFGGFLHKALLPHLPPPLLKAFKDFRHNVEGLSEIPNTSQTLLRTLDVLDAHVKVMVTETGLAIPEGNLGKDIVVGGLVISLQAAAEDTDFDLSVYQCEPPRLAGSAEVVRLETGRLARRQSSGLRLVTNTKA